MPPARRLLTAPTPGPWTVARSQRPPERLFIHGPNGQSIGMVFEKVGPNDPGHFDDPGFSNAHWAASAPELVELLVALLCAAKFADFVVAAERSVRLLDSLGVDPPLPVAIVREGAVH